MRSDAGIAKHNTIIKQCNKCGKDVDRIYDIPRVICIECKQKSNRKRSKENMRDLRKLRGNRV